MVSRSVLAIQKKNCRY